MFSPSLTWVQPVVSVPALSVYVAVARPFTIADVEHVVSFVVKLPPLCVESARAIVLPTTKLDSCSGVPPCRLYVPLLAAVEAQVERAAAVGW